MLSLRSMEQGECVVAAAPFCVRDLVASVLAVCRMSLAHRSSVRVLWLDESYALPPLVLGDADRIAQVLQNLLTSAALSRRGYTRAPRTNNLMPAASQMRSSSATAVT